MPILWNNCLSVCIPELDEQHKVLIQQVNVLATGIAGRHDEAAQLSAFDQLLQHAGSHFHDEEHYFEPLGCPWAAEHRQVHGLLLSRLGRLRKLLAEEGVGLTEGLLRGLEDLLVEHIVVYDMQYAVPHANSRAAMANVWPGARPGSLSASLAGGK